MLPCAEPGLRDTPSGETGTNLACYVPVGPRGGMSHSEPRDMTAQPKAMAAVTVVLGASAAVLFLWRRRKHTSVKGFTPAHAPKRAARCAETIAAAFTHDPSSGTEFYCGTSDQSFGHEFWRRLVMETILSDYSSRIVLSTRRCCYTFN